MNLDYLYISFFNIFCLFIWFKTDAFIEYFKYIPYCKYIFKIDNYNKYLKDITYVSYPIYLQLNHNNFFTRLISCPYCMLFWINCFNLFFYKFSIYFFVNYILSLIGYCLVNLLVKKYESSES